MKLNLKILFWYQIYSVLLQSLVNNFLQHRLGLNLKEKSLVKSPLFVFY